MTHPEELLADYVDGTLPENRRSELEGHLATCETCRQEAELAGRGRTALASLPELEVPPSTVRPGLTRLRPARPDRARRVAWAAGLAAAASFVAIFALIVVGNSHGNEAIPAAIGAATPSSPESLTNGVVLRSENYDNETIRALAARLAGEVAEQEDRTAQRKATATTAGASADTTGSGGGAGGGAVAPPAPSATSLGGAPSGAESANGFAGVDTVAKRSVAARCLRTGSGLGEAPLVKIIQATFQEQPAFIGAFVLDGTPPDRLVLWAVSQEGCEGLSHAEQPVPLP